MKLKDFKNRFLSIVMMLSAFITVLIFSSCDDLDEIYVAPPPPGGCDTINVTFSSTIKNIITARCSCHGASAKDLTIYSNLKSSVDNGKLIQYIQPGSHFSGALDTCEVKQITAWINKGAPNN
jgi:hypothetical protein